MNASGPGGGRHVRPSTTQGGSPLTGSATAAKVWSAFGTAGAVLAADFLSKAWATRQVSSESATSGAIVQLRHVANSGASFGLGA